MFVIRLQHTSRSVRISLIWTLLSQRVVQAAGWFRRATLPMSATPRRSAHYPVLLRRRPASAACPPPRIGLVFLAARRTQDVVSVGEETASDERHVAFEALEAPVVPLAVVKRYELAVFDACKCGTLSTSAIELHDTLR